MGAVGLRGLEISGGVGSFGIAASNWGRRKVGFEYQACGEFKCLPPTKLVLDLDLATIPAEEIIAGKNGKSSRTP